MCRSFVELKVYMLTQLIKLIIVFSSLFKFIVIQKLFNDIYFTE